MKDLENSIIYQVGQILECPQTQLPQRFVKGIEGTYAREVLGHTDRRQGGDYGCT